MAKTKVLQKIITIFDGKFADIETLDNSILMGTVGVAMAIDKLRESLDRVESHLDDREFKKASHAGYQDVAYNFVYVQRTLSGLQTAVYQKEALISNIAQEANTYYEDVAPYVDHKMKSAVKKSVFPAKKATQSKSYPPRPDAGGADPCDVKMLLGCRLDFNCKK